MKRGEIQELKNKTKEELENLLAEWRSKLRSLEFDLEAGKVKNVKEVKNAKKCIARILTFLNVEVD